MPMEGDMNVRMMCKKNDQYGSLYMGRSEGLRRYMQKGGAVCQGWTDMSVNCILCGTSGRTRDVAI